MTNKRILPYLIFLFVAINLLIFAISVHSAILAQETVKNSDLIRVGISTNDFSQFEYNQVSITSPDKFELIDRSNNTTLAQAEENHIYTIEIKDGIFSVKDKDSVIMANIKGPIRIKTQNSSPINIVGLKRAGKLAFYRGEIEIIKSQNKNDKFSLVNVLPLDDYLKGVVPNELPVSFGIEALKAQAIAARNYVIKPRIKTNNNFDICDSVQCQVYFGYNTEHQLSNHAVDETKNLVALYNGDIILALYSSTAGGYTENYENAFSEPGTDIFPARPLPYLRGKPDIEGSPTLETEDNARLFYTSSPDSFDIKSGYYRWTKTWTREELENILNKTLVKNSYSSLICPKLEKDATIGTLIRIDVLSRGVSGKATAIQITASNGTWIVKKELFIRKIFENSGKMLPSANIIFNNTYDENNNLINIETIGGGFGHGVGMSQYGAGFMSKNGYKFDEILQHYYTDISIGTPPVILTETNNQIKQQFSSPYGKAELVLINREQANNFKVYINSYELNIPENELCKEKVKINLDEYTQQGLNEITYYLPENQEEGKSVKAWVEVVKSKNDW